MAQRKIKDLIREMIFENQTNEHQYANVMANLVFNRNKTADYDKQLDIVEKQKQQYDEQIQKINRALDKKTKKIQAQKSLKSSIDLQEFKSAMAKLNKQKKILDNLQDETIAQKIQHGFPTLDPIVKKWAVLKYLANTCIKNEDFPIQTGSDGFLYADEYEFKSSQTAQHFREIIDYVDYIFGNRASKITEPQSVIEIIKNDAKDLDINIKTITPVNIVMVYNALLERIARENRKKQTEQEAIEQSQIGLRPIQDFNNGLIMYRLLPDTEYYNQHGKHRNLAYESDQMGICIGREGQPYSKRILDTKKNQYYTLRSTEQNGQLIPHCTIEVNGDTITQVKGKANGPVNAKYIQPVRDFLKNHLNCAFPGESRTGKRVLYDATNIGFIQDIHGNTVDLFNLPENTELGTIQYDLLTTRGVNINNIKSINTVSYWGITITSDDFAKISKIGIKIKSHDFHMAKISGDLDFSGVKDLDLYHADLTNVTSIKFNPNAEEINLSHTKGLSGDLNFSGVNKLYLYGADLTDVTGIKFNPDAEIINLNNTQGLSGDLNFSGVNNLDLQEADLTNVTDIKFNPNAEIINLNNTKGLSGNLDFSGVKELYLDGANLTKVINIKFNPNAENINLSDTRGLFGDLDFSSVKELNLRNADLTNVTNIKFNPNAGTIDLYNTQGLSGDLNFSGVNKLYLYGADLTDVTGIKFNPHAEKIDLQCTKGLSGDLDFSGVKELDLMDADLTDVTSIKINNVEKCNLAYAKLSGNLDFSGVKELDLQNADLTKVTNIKFNPNARIHLDYAKLSGDWDFEQNYLYLQGIDFTNVTSIKFGPSVKELHLRDSRFSGDLEFSGVKELELYQSDLTKVTNIKFNNVEIAKITIADGLSGDLDFSGVKELHLVFADLTNVTSIKFNSNADKIYLCDIELSGDLDFSGAKELEFLRVDFKNMTSIILPQGCDPEEIFKDCYNKPRKRALRNPNKKPNVFTRAKNKIKKIKETTAQRIAMRRAAKKSKE